MWQLVQTTFGYEFYIHVYILCTFSTVPGRYTNCKYLFVVNYCISAP